MSMVESIKLLHCLNETGIDKVHEFLEELVHDPECLQVTPEQLQQGAAVTRRQAEEEMRKAEREAEQKRRNRRQEIRQQYATEFKLIDNSKAFWEQEDILKAINATDEYGGVFVLTRAYNWGYIQGERAERARRKKVQP
ncbi:putative glycosyl hydrolase (DUF1957 family) [Anaerotaenia torta]|uniref:hypothetical protein n=1 Tax=Anaerotaenia torta TaxID=433293 RepID=UPI003D2118A1